VLALLEAMSLGLPSVASATAAHRAVMEDGQHGRLVPSRQPQALAEAVIELWHDAEQAARLGRAAGERASREFSLDRCLQQHLALLTQVQEQFVR
jgi:glycosyltransferase involved in cell wall biosynthesis